jgi:hypothetical protein
LFGVWDRIMAYVSAQGEPKLAVAYIDSSIARAHQKATGARLTARAANKLVDPRPMCSTTCQGEALGRSRGGLGMKIVRVFTEAGRLLGFILVPDQGHELAPSLRLLKRSPEPPDWALADMVCDAREIGLAAMAREHASGTVRDPRIYPRLLTRASTPS